MPFYYPQQSGLGPGRVELCTVSPQMEFLDSRECRKKPMLLFSCQVVSDASWPHGLQCARLLSPPPSPRVCPSLCPLHWWCYLTISSSVALFSFCLQSFPASGSFLMSRLFASGGQNIGASASASVLPMSFQGWFLLGLTGLISLQSKGLSRLSSQHHSLKASILRRSAFFTVQFSHPHMTTGKT